MISIYHENLLFQHYTFKQGENLQYFSNITAKLKNTIKSKRV